MKNILGTVGKIAVGLSFGFGVGLATWVAGVCYGAAGAIQATRDDDGTREQLEEQIKRHAECAEALGEVYLDK